MIRTAIAAALLLAAAPASAQTAIGNSPAALGVAAAGAVAQNVVVAQTAHNELLGTDGVTSAGSTAFYSPSATFAPTDVGKTIILDGVGASGADLITTIAAFTDAHHVTLASATDATYGASPWWSIGRAVPAQTETITASYSIGDYIYPTGGTYSTQGAFRVVSVGVTAPTVNAGGTGGTTGTGCTFQGTTGATRSWFANNTNATTAANSYFTFTGSVSGGALTGPLTIVKTGDYSTAPTTAYTAPAEPVVPIIGCAGLTGATVSFRMAPYFLQQTTPGRYTALPANTTTTPTTTSGTGVGATLLLWGQFPSGQDASTTVAGDQVGGLWAYGTDDSDAINAAISAVSALGGGTVALPGGRSLMLSAIAVPFASTTPPTQASIRIAGTGNIGVQSVNGNYTDMYAAPLQGSMIDLRYAGGDSAGHTAKLDTRGFGVLEIDHVTLADYGTDNYQFFQTSNTTPYLHEDTILGNPSCYRMTCVQNGLALGAHAGTIGAYSTSQPNAPYQGYNGHIANVNFGHIQEAYQFGVSANNIRVEGGDGDMSNGSYSATSGFMTFYGVGMGNSDNTLIAGNIESTGYIYPILTRSIGGGDSNNNVFLNGPQCSDDSATVADKYTGNGQPTVGCFYFDANAARNVVNSVSVAFGLTGNFVAQAGAAPNNMLILNYSGVPSFLPSGANVLGLLGVGTQTPVYTVDVGAGTSQQTLRLNGGNGASQGGQIIVSGAGSGCDYIGNKSAVLGGSYDGTMQLNSNCGSGVAMSVFASNRLLVGNTAISAFVPLTLESYTVATLPTCNAGLKGSVAYVTDATSPTYNGTLTGSGSVAVPAFCNGSAWTAH